MSLFGQIRCELYDLKMKLYTKSQTFISIKKNNIDIEKATNN